FYARAEIKDALAYVRLVANRNDSAALLRIINTPPRGIGEATVNALAETARAHNLTLWRALEHSLDVGPAPPRAAGALKGFRDLIELLAEDLKQLPLSDFFQRLLERTEYIDVLRAEKTPDAESRIENLEELANAAAEAQERGETLGD